MNIFNLQPVVRNLMDKFSSIFLASGGLISKISLDTIFSNILGIFANAFYFVAKWAMYFIDIMYFYMLQLAGVNIDTSSLEALTSADSDMVFNFLISNKNLVTTVIKNFLAIAIILIIVTAIIAIIKQQFKSIEEKKVNKNANGNIFKSMAKSFVLLVLTPLIAIVGIIASNILLKSLFNATNLTEATSLSARIFNVSATSANRYRIYADSNLRIPVMLDFKDDGNNSGKSKSQKIEYAAYTLGSYYLPKQSNFNESEYLFSEYDFTTYDYLKKSGNDYVYLDDIEKYEKSNTKIVVESTDKFDTCEKFKTNYYTYFDHSEKFDINSTGINRYRYFDSYREDYYVMSDVVDFALETMKPLYFVTIQKMLESVCGSPTLFREMIETYNIKLFTFASGKSYIGRNASGIITSIDDMRNAVSGRNYQGIEFSIKYNGVEHTYVHVANATNELDGAKYLVTYKSSYQTANGNVNCFLPLSKGVSISGNTFNSENITRGQLVIAKGVFDKAGYPTAIDTDSKDDIVFFRDDLELIADGSSADLAHVDGKEVDEQGALSGVFSAITNFVKSIFNPVKMVPDLNLDTSAMSTTYDKYTHTVQKLEDGKLHISYFYSDALTSSAMKNSYGLSLCNLFDPMSINYVILLVGAAIFLKVCFQYVFALIGRSLDLFLLILIYPLACATIPIDEYDQKGKSNSYKKWSDAYTKKLLSTYGLILSINFVFLLFPVIESIEFFTEVDLSRNLATQRIIGGIYSLVNFVPSIFGNGNFVTISMLCNFINLLVSIMFELVAFSFIAPLGKGPKEGTFYTAIQDLAGGDNLDGNAGTKVITTTKKVAKGVTDTVNFLLVPIPKKIEMVGKKAAETFSGAANMIPGSALIKQAKADYKEHNVKKQQDSAKEDLMKSLDAKAPKEEVEAKLKTFNEAFGTSISLGNKEPKKEGEEKPKENARQDVDDQQSEQSEQNGENQENTNSQNANTNANPESSVEKTEDTIENAVKKDIENAVGKENLDGSSAGSEGEDKDQSADGDKDKDSSENSSDKQEAPSEAKQGNNSGASSQDNDANTRDKIKSEIDELSRQKKETETQIEDTQISIDSNNVLHESWMKMLEEFKNSGRSQKDIHGLTASIACNESQTWDLGEKKDALEEKMKQIDEKIKELKDKLDAIDKK